MEVESPSKEVEALHVSVGVSVVWVVSKDYKVSQNCSQMCNGTAAALLHSVCVPERLCVQVWFRRGVNSHNPCGSGWIGIGGEMMVVDVGLNDQVKRFR